MRSTQGSSLHLATRRTLVRRSLRTSPFPCLMKSPKNEIQFVFKRVCLDDHNFLLPLFVNNEGFFFFNF